MRSEKEREVYGKINQEEVTKTKKNVKVENATGNRRKRFSFCFSRTKVCHMPRCIASNFLLSLVSQSFTRLRGRQTHAC